MRTTVTLDADSNAIVRTLMRERGLSFKEALNEAIRVGARGRRRSKPFRTRTFDMGRSALPVDKALQLAGALEDEELMRKLAGRK